MRINIRLAYISFLLILLQLAMPLKAQYKMRYDKHQLATTTVGPDCNNGFRVSMSLVAMFTTGAADRNGLRLGVGLACSQTIGKWCFSLGADAYKAKEQFGLGTTYGGLQFNKDGYGGAYWLNHYYQGDSQTSGLISLYLDEVQINFEDDILGIPLTKMKIYDRYRTAALEVRYRHILIGTNVYTTDINGVTDFSSSNTKGMYFNGKQISSPLYVGYTSHELIVRTGINSSLGGLLGQNGWHRLFFDTPDFRKSDYKQFFLQTGVDKPYTLY